VSGGGSLLRCVVLVGGGGGGRAKWGGWPEWVSEWPGGGDSILDESGAHALESEESIREQRGEGWDGCWAHVVPCWGSGGGRGRGGGSQGS